MHTAKIIRHRHKHHHYINDDLKSISEVVHFKIVFSHPAELTKFEKWCTENEGSYDYDKDHACQRGKMPTLEIFTTEICWCDIMSFYLLHVADYSFHSSIHPYKGETYVKNDAENAFRANL